MSEFMDRARAEAERRWPGCALHQVCEHQMRDEFQERDRFLTGAQWASEQEPTDAEVEAAARVIVFQFDYGQRQWDDASEQARSQALYEARDALRAAQKVRAGQ